MEWIPTLLGLAEKAGLAPVVLLAWLVGMYVFQKLGAQWIRLKRESTAETSTYRTLLNAENAALIAGLREELVALRRRIDERDRDYDRLRSLYVSAQRTIEGHEARIDLLERTLSQHGIAIP